MRVGWGYEVHAFGGLGPLLLAAQPATVPTLGTEKVSRTPRQSSQEKFPTAETGTRSP